LRLLLSDQNSVLTNHARLFISVGSIFPFIDIFVGVIHNSDDYVEHHNVDSQSREEEEHRIYCCILRFFFEITRESAKRLNVFLKERVTERSVFCEDAVGA